MKTDFKFVRSGLLLAFLLLSSTLYAQESYDDPYLAPEKESFQDDSFATEAPVESEPVTPPVSEQPSAIESTPGYTTGTPYTSALPEVGQPPEAATEAGFQNAIIEGVQLTAETGTVPDEKLVTGYFIFRDKPSSYFYEVKLREKKLIFEFNDTRVGSSPVPTASEPPIKGFIIEQGKIDVNKAVKGLRPEWHDLIRVVFDLEAVPEVHVNDEYSIISFSFKWTSDPAKQKKYTVRDQTPKVILWSTAGVGGVALGAVAYLLLRPDGDEKPLTKLSIDDLPAHNF
jgi:hypothetical protein